MGALASQAVLLVSAPVLTRIYTPAELGVLATLTAMAALVSPISALHFELAVPIAKGAQQAEDAFRLACISTLLVASIAALVVYLGSWHLLEGPDTEGVTNLLLYVPVSILFTGLSGAILMWAIRHERHVANAGSKLTAATTQSSVQIGAGLAGLGAPGLLLGQLTGQLLGMLTLARNCPALPRLKTSNGQWGNVIKSAIENKNFLIYSAPSSAVNAFGANMPVLMLAAQFDAHVAGLFGMGYRVLQLPARLVGQSIAQVFYSTAAQERSANRLPAAAERLLLATSSLALYTFIPLGLIAPELFSLAFGKEWREAGVYAQYFMPWVATAFVSMPVSMIVSVLGEQKNELVLQLVYLVAAVLAALAAGLEHDARLTVATLSCVGSCYFALKITWLIKISGCDLKILLRRTVGEAGGAILLSFPLIIAIVSEVGSVNIVALGICSIAIAHAFNLRKRSVYEV